jgi:hypothetical protein
MLVQNGEDVETGTYTLNARHIIYVRDSFKSYRRFRLVKATARWHPLVGALASGHVGYCLSAGRVDSDVNTVTGQEHNYMGHIKETEPVTMSFPRLDGFDWFPNTDDAPAHYMTYNYKAIGHTGVVGYFDIGYVFEFAEPNVHVGYGPEYPPGFPGNDPVDGSGELNHRHDPVANMLASISVAPSLATPAQAAECVLAIRRLESRLAVLKESYKEEYQQVNGEEESKSEVGEEY